MNFDIFIEQNNRIIIEENGVYSIDDQKLNILVKNADNRTIHIFAYHNEEMFKKYSYPIKCENTVIFHPATALMDKADENMEITLTINREMQYNAITPEKRTGENGTAIIKIKDIADIDDKFSGILYLAVFIDFNENNIIDENEIRNLSIKIDRSNNSILFRARIYVSTMGSWIRNIGYPVYSNDYMYVKITNETEKQYFLSLFGESNFINTYSTINRIVNLDYTRYNMYVIFSPVTKEIELFGNPYYYSGENRLIFETRINRESNRGLYVFCREYRVEKNSDRFDVWINDNGELRRINRFEL
ncbi:MAG: hypothetical protein LBQ69_03680 [Treponema sp.]|jgi:hypothetical protein|nr:hypothetical protein [Treponema sp.]